MKIYRNDIKIKSPDYYRKKYWHERCDPGENSVGEYSLSCTVSLITCASGIKPHIDFESMCWVLVLHNQRYKFQYGRRLFKINPGDLTYLLGVNTEDSFTLHRILLFLPRKRYIQSYLLSAYILHRANALCRWFLFKNIE